MASLTNSLIVGAQKSGTTSLFFWLRGHPDIFAPEGVKDLHFFSEDHLWEKGQDYYSGFFAGHESEKIVLGAGANLIYSIDAAKRIYETNPETKLVLILRNPARRAYSAYTNKKRLGLENREVGSVFKSEMKCLQGGKIEDLQSKYIFQSMYYRHLSSYLKYFPLAQVKIMFLEEVEEDPKREIRELFKFLDVDSSFTPDFNIVNRTGRPKIPVLNKLVFGSHPIKGFLRKILFYDKLFPQHRRIIFRNRLREWNTKAASYEEMPMDLYAEVFDFLEKDIQGLEREIERELSIWRSNKPIPPYS